MDEKAEICIIAVGYNRPDAMERLLNSLSRANYSNHCVDLLISIDKGTRQAEIVEISEKFTWEHGKKIIRAFSERQGLRAHILQCGDMTDKYNAVVILEDDITVSECFFQYVEQSIAFYGHEKRIGGISLYKHQTNIGTNCFFEPEYNSYDAYLIQYAQSWGQCWTKDMWRGFKTWYIKNQDDFFERRPTQLFDRIPDNILFWDSHSWLKYAMAYTVEQDLYYVYPYYSLSTNHSETGQHNAAKSVSDYQVALATGNKEYRFPNFENAVRYDVFFERCNYQVSGFENKTVILDLYGNKKVYDGEILISSKCLPYKVLKMWELAYRPQELNCRFPQDGTDLYVYDLSINATPPKQIHKLMRTRYDVRATSWKCLLKLGLMGLKNACLNKVKRLVKIS